MKHGFASGGSTAPNPMSGAVISYYPPAEIKVSPEQKKKTQTPVKITISDSSGQVIRTMYGPSKYGVNRTSWKLPYDRPKRLAFIPGEEPEKEFFFDPNVWPTGLPGTHKIPLPAAGQ